MPTCQVNWPGEFGGYGSGTEYDSINECIAAAADQDFIFVQSGTHTATGGIPPDYADSVIYMQDVPKALLFKCVNADGNPAPGTCIIDGQNTRAGAFLFNSGTGNPRTSEGIGSSWDGFAFVNGKANVEGGNCGTALFTNCTFRDGTHGSYSGAGIYFDGRSGSRLVLDHCIIENNTVSRSNRCDGVWLRGGHTTMNATKICNNYQYNSTNTTCDMKLSHGALLYEYPTTHWRYGANCIGTCDGC